MRKLIILFAAALFNCTAFAQTTWNSDKAHSNLSFTVTHLGVSDVTGLFKDFNTAIVAAKPDFSDAKFTLSASTTSINTEVEMRDEDLRSANFFDVKNFPEMTFVSNAISKTSPSHYGLSGKLTIHGVTKPVSLIL